MIDTVHYSDVMEIESVVKKLESCEYAKDEFTHARHLAVAAWYSTHFPDQQALDKMRSSLLRFTKHHQVKGYHETITRFWLALVREFLRSCRVDSSFSERVNALIQLYRDKNVLFEFYSRDRVMSDHARGVWIEPDLKHLSNL